MPFEYITDSGALGFSPRFISTWRERCGGALVLKFVQLSHLFIRTTPLKTFMLILSSRSSLRAEYQLPRMAALHSGTPSLMFAPTPTSTTSLLDRSLTRCWTVLVNGEWEKKLLAERETWLLSLMFEIAEYFFSPLTHSMTVRAVKKLSILNRV